MIQRLSLAAVLTLSSALFWSGCNAQRAATPTLTTPYVAVLLDNGSVFFGQIEGMGQPEVTLKDVYYVQTRVDQESKKQSSVLIRRGKEWHAPDRMIINSNKSVFIEPVSKDSTVAKLIEESKHQ